jgi:hypothetical protein
MLMTACGLLLCAAPFFVKDKSLYKGGWNTQHSAHVCGEDLEGQVEDCSTRVRDFSGMVVIFVGFFITGIGSSFFYSFGIPYMDDNVSKEASPGVLGIVLGSRTLGPGLGYLLGSFCLSIYVSPGLEGSLLEGDDGWLGAWWLGFVIVGTLTALVAPLLALFPERLQSDEDTFAKRFEKTQDDMPKTGMEYIQDTKACAMRLIKNKLYVCNMFSAVTALLAFVGLGTFIPKYFEYHFRQKATRSGLSSLGSSIFTGLGIVISGQVIQRYKFRAKTLAAWSMIVGILAVLTMIIMSLIACPQLEVYGGPGSETPECQRGCSCSQSEFKPTCSTDGLTLFFSPCHAGCKSTTVEQVSGADPVTIFQDCSCISQAAAERNLTVTSAWWREEVFKSPLVIEGAVPSGGVDGFCPSSNCDDLFYLTIGIMGFMSLIASTSRVGGTLISLRAVEPEDKSASLVILISVLSLFAFFPSPIIFGALIDNACTIWGSSCGEETNCLLYDTDAMRNTICWFTAACLFVSFLFDVLVWRFSDGLQLYQEETETGDTELELKAPKECNTA